jgi:PAS domain S-box-containing protein
MGRKTWLKNTSTNLLKILLIVASWEALLMYALSKTHLKSPILETIIDTSLLAILTGLSVIFIIIRPEQNRIAKEHSESLNFLDQELRAVSDIGIVSAADLDGKIIFANDNFCNISGYARRELIGHDHRMVNSGLHSKEFFNQMWANLKIGKAWQGKLRNVKKNGEFYWVHAYITPIYNNQGEIYKYVSFRFDITNDKLIEDSYELEKVKSTIIL